MADSWRDRLRKVIDERGLNMKELSLAAGLGETFVRDVLEKGVNPRAKNLERVAQRLGMTLAELYEGEGSLFQQIPVIGCVSAGEGWEAFEGDGPVGDAELRLEGGEPVALEVRGDSMAPVYRDGDLIIGTKRAGAAADNLIGLDCIIMTDDGRRFVKFLARGFSKGKFNLRSYNPNHKDIENVKLAWAAPILWIKRTQR